MLTKPNCTVSVRKLFSLDTDLEVPAFSERNIYVPAIDEHYIFDHDTTIALLMGFAHNLNVLIHGYHGTGKSSHIEQVAARLNWPLLRINLDSFITRYDLIGRETIALQDGKQVSQFKEGILTFALTHGIALLWDEYDAARPEILFTLQRVLEAEGKLTLIERNEEIVPHPNFRLFATANTIGSGNSSGIYHGTYTLNQGHMDRWNIILSLNYLPEAQELAIVTQRFPTLKGTPKEAILEKMVRLANLTRTSFKNGDISLMLSPRTVLHWVTNYILFDNLPYSFQISFMNRCNDEEKAIINELYQRCFGEDLPSTVLTST